MTRLVAVLGYSDASTAELHPVCGARLARAAAEARADDVVLFSGWARGRAAAPEAELMAAAGRLRLGRSSSTARRGRRSATRSPSRVPPASSAPTRSSLVTSRWHAQARGGARTSRADRVRERRCGSSRPTSGSRPRAGCARPLPGWRFPSSRVVRGPDALGSRPCVAVSHSQEPCLALVGVAAGCGGDDEPEDELDGRVGQRLLQRDHRAGRTSSRASRRSSRTRRPLAGRDSLRRGRRRVLDGGPRRRAPRASARRRRSRARRSKTALDTLSTTLETEADEIRGRPPTASSGITDIPGALTTITASLSAMAIVVLERR